MATANLNPGYDFSQMHESFQALLRNGQNFQMFDILPTPIEVFAPDGTVVYVNQSCLAFVGLKDASLHIGKYNLLHDPVCDQIFGHERLESAFHGEAVSWFDMPVPIQDVVDRGIIEEKPFESAFMDFHLLPVWDGDRLAYVVGMYHLNRMYQGPPQVAKAKEYIESHWQEAFDYEAVARAANISGASLYRMFNEHVGMTPKDYYHKVKLGHIQEKLQDKTLSVAEAFSFCGVDSQGRAAKIFKNMTGMTPTEYRKSIGIG